MSAPRRWIGTFGERFAEIRPVHHDILGTVFAVKVDGDPLSPHEVFLEDAKEAAETKVNHPLTWSVE